MTSITQSMSWWWSKTCQTDNYLTRYWRLLNDNLVTGFWWFFSKLVNLVTIWWGNYINFDKITDVMLTSFWLHSDNFTSKTSRDEAKLVVFVSITLTTQGLSVWRPKTCQIDNYLTRYWRLLNDNVMTCCLHRRNFNNPKLVIMKA